MILYVSLTIWLFVILLIGLRPDSCIAVECWPSKPQGRLTINNLKISNTLAFVTMAVLWFLTAFRSENIGNDTSTYIYYFQRIFSMRGIDRTRTFEIGYQYLNVLIGKITSDPHIFIVIIASVMYLGVMVYFFKFSKNILVSVSFFFGVCFSMFTSMFRQGIAMIIALYGYQALKNNKKLTACLLFLSAALFHASAIVCFFLFFNTRLLKKKWIVFGVTVMCAIASISGVFNSLVVAIIPRYAHYFVSRYASTGWFAVSSDVIRNLVWYWLVSVSADQKKREDQLAVTNFTLLLLFGAFGYSVNLFTRAGGYFLLIAMTELPNLLYIGKIKHPRRWLLGICTVLLIMFLVILIYRPGWNHLYPYEFWE